MLHNKYFWTTLSIVGIWLMIALVGLFSPEPALAVPLSGAAMFATVAIAICGFRGSPPMAG